MPAPTTADVLSALRRVIDPELGADIVELGMVQDVAVADGGAVTVKVALTIAGCPLRTQIKRDVEGRLRSLPGVTDVRVDFGEMLEACNKAIAKYANLKESVKALAEISSDKIKLKCYILSADIAMSSGDVSEEEDRLLETMQRMFGIDDNTAGAVLNVLTAKYAQ